MNQQIQSIKAAAKRTAQLKAQNIARLIFETLIEKQGPANNAGYER